MILVDTDVLLDVALDRKPHARASADLLDLLQRRGRGGFVAWHSLSNLYYLVRPGRGGSGVRELLRDLTGFLTVVPTDTDALRYATDLPLADLEDAMQVAAAWSCGATLIATRNVTDFRESPVPALTPAEILADEE